MKPIKNSSFTRNTYCIMGLPFDAISLDQTHQRLLENIDANDQCFLSTPNLNFLAAANRDEGFRNSVIHSDLSIPDGMPIIWICKFLGIPIHERVAGSDLMDKFTLSTTNKPVKVFFFGGEDGVAEKSSAIINAIHNKQLISTGHYYPGFGSVAEMSTPDIISHINLCEADFVIVSLGANKGQQWIECNRHKLDAPIVSHLGAVVNFFAGSVTRSPLWIQKAGGEWLWRIAQEPKLFQRYLKDGLFLIKSLITRILPYKLFLMFNRPAPEAQHGEIHHCSNQKHQLSFTGIFSDSNTSDIKQALKLALASEQDIEIDLNNCTYIDSSFIGLLLLLKKACYHSSHNLAITPPPPAIEKIFFYCGAEYLLKNA